MTGPRQIWLLEGNRARAIEALPQLPVDTLWVGSEATSGVRAVSPKQVQACLGSEYRLLVFDAHMGLDVDALAAAMGTLRGGGLVLLLTPVWDEWGSSDDSALRFTAWPLGREQLGRRFVARLQRMLQASPAVVRLSAGEPFQLPTLPDPGEGVFTLNDCQRRVVDAVQRVALGHARRPLVLLADRGRGKSTALGAALAGLLRERPRDILLIAPAADAVQAIFDQLARDLPQGQRDADGFHFNGAVVGLRPLHEQLQAPQDCGLLVIDEAAAIPLHHLALLLRLHNRVVFSTTVHGYEGSGRGFVLRFLDLLTAECRQWQCCELEEPVRWGRDDPLERLLNRVLLLDAEPQPAPAGDRVEYLQVSQRQLATDEDLLRQVFALLVSAHYQTRPSDLQQVLDAPGLSLLLAMRESAVLGCALLVEEGGLPGDLAEAVAAGQRRPRGHMLVQSLALHLGLSELPRLRLLRVMRIAVQADSRRRGVGLGLLRQAHGLARETGFDLLGSAFAIDDQVLAFWRSAGFRPVRLGRRVDASSGSHSLQVLSACGQAGEALVERAATRFERDWPVHLLRVFNDLDTGTGVALLQGADHPLQAVAQDDAQLVRAFALGGPGLIDAMPALWRWTCSLAAQGLLDCRDDEQRLLAACVLQGRPLPNAPPNTHWGRRASPQNRLRAVVKKLTDPG